MATKKQNAAVAAPAEAIQAAGRQTAEAVTKAFKGYDELVAAGKDNLDAVVQANTAAVAGAKRLNTEVSAYLNAAYKANLAVAKALTGAKTVHEAVELQTGHVRATLDTAFAKGTEISEVAFAEANDVAEPLQARTKVVFDKLMTPLAA